MKKQFIAGAVCPGCKKIDKIKSWVSEGYNHIECVSCGYKDAINLKDNETKTKDDKNIVQVVNIRE